MHDSVLVTAVRTLEIARGSYGRDDGASEVERPARPPGKKRPSSERTHPPKHARRRESPSDLAHRSRKRSLLQEKMRFRNRTTRRLPVPPRDGHTSVVRICSLLALERVAPRRWLLMRALHASHGPAGRERRSRGRSPLEGSVVQGCARARKRSRTIRRRRPLIRTNGPNHHRACELGFRGQPPCVSALVGSRGAASYRREQTR